MLNIVFSIQCCRILWYNNDNYIRMILFNINDRVNDKMCPLVVHATYIYIPYIVSAVQLKLAPPYFTVSMQLHSIFNVCIT